MIKIKEAQPDDYPSLAALLSLTQQKSVTPAYWERMVNFGRVTTYPHVAVKNDDLWGACFLNQSENDGFDRYSIHIHVHPNYQRNGIGTMLYQDALKFAKAKGLSSFYSYVFDNRPGGLPFAKKQGFVIIRQAIHSRLNVAAFDEQHFLSYLTHNELRGIHFTTLADMGDNLGNRRLLYDLNKRCSADIPGRGPFFSFEAFCKQRFESSAYSPKGVILALDKDNWIGLSAATYHQQENFVFNEMTGVLPSYRKQGIAIALKLLVTRFAQTLNAETIRTFNDSKNESILAVNQRMGYEPWTSSYKMEATFD